MNKEEKVVAFYEMLKGLAVDELTDILGEINIISDNMLEAQCGLEGHKFSDDTCGLKEHRFCTRCFARQDKVDESEDCKSSLPSESLGSGSNLSNPKPILAKLGAWLLG